MANDADQMALQDRPLAAAAALVVPRHLLTGHAPSTLNHCSRSRIVGSPTFQQRLFGGSRCSGHQHSYMFF
jgi:hypothetical protein